MKFTISSSVLDDLEGYKSLIYVDRNSDRNTKEALANLAVYFKKEMRFDHLQFDESMFGGMTTLAFFS